MAEYDYDEGGFMALYFLLTFLIIVLLILTPSLIPSWQKPVAQHCQCSECHQKQRRIAKTRGTSFFKLTPKGTIALVVWGVFFAVAYKLATTKVESKIYDPFAILGLAPTDDEKAIKKHYKRLSIKFHPDKVKLAINQTIEEISSHFVDLTKAYKALTDDSIRENLRLYGNPDGKQDFKVGIALPPWIIESANNGYVLGLYALLIGGALPYLVGRWWFSSRQFTKDGVKARTAETFFKSMKEEDSVDDVVGILAKGWQFEADSVSSPTEISHLEALVQATLSSDTWDKLTNRANETTKRAIILLYAYFLRLPIEKPSLRKEQIALLLHTPQLLTSLLAITLSHNWLIPTLHVMHLHAYLAQAIRPGSDELLQLPGIKDGDVAALGGSRDITNVFKEMLNQGDSRVEATRKASLRWGSLEILDLHFKVIGERIITPSAIVQLVFKLRLISPLESSISTGGGESLVGGAGVDAAKRTVASESERIQAFLNSKKEAEELQPGDSGFGFAHAPYWPEDRRPSWWVLVGDQKLNRVIVPPTRFTDVPYPSAMSSSSAEKTDRIYKIQFQAPPTVGAYTFQIHFISDTFVVEDVRQNITLKVEDVSALTADEQAAEDEISDPEEDTIAGQMAAMRGGPVKKLAASGSDDDESTTDGEQSSGSDSDSDSD